MHRRSKRLTALILICLLTSVGLGGCSQPVRKTSTEPLWPELDRQVEDCKAMTGRYIAIPRIHAKATKLGTPLLAYTLLPFSEKLSDADQVDLIVTDTQLIVTALNDDSPLLSHTYTAESGVFACISGSLEFAPQLKPGGPPAATSPGLGWETVRLRRTVDGSLLLQEAGGLAGLAFMLFPIYFTNDHWYLFKPVE